MERTAGRGLLCLAVKHYSNITGPVSAVVHTQFAQTKGDLIVSTMDLTLDRLSGESSKTVPNCTYFT